MYDIETRKLKSHSTFLETALGCDLKHIYENGEHVDDNPIPYSPKRMKPIARHATEGRANPKGIPYLYLATNPETALAEIRPWKESFISLGKFKTVRSLRLINCIIEPLSHHIYFNEPSVEKREESVWSEIDRAFARPVNNNDDVADYVPTQIIAELFKANKFDGIAYRSSLGNGSGHNIALFGVDMAELVECFVFGVKNINYEFHQFQDSYIINK